MGENIGAVARAMSNFGLHELRIAAPRDGWPNPKALEMAAGAENIIQAAQVFPDFKSATADIQFAYATTARKRYMEKRIIEPAEAMAEMKALLSPSPLEGEGGVGGKSQTPEQGASPLPNPPPQGGREYKVALVFGPERSGLENDEVTWCDMLITIPTAPENSSLNIAQSMVILGYEWWHSTASPSLHTTTPPAPRTELEGLFGQLETYLDEVDYWRVPEKKPLMWQNLQTMFLRASLNSQEVRTLRGMMRGIWERRKD